jgi:very-short-patch-repair endonuclease
MSIVKGKFSKRKFIKERAKELNYDLPKSEVWFFEKFKHSFLYRTMKWEANLPVFDCYIVDWFCGRYRFVIEVDGTFHNKKETIEKDKIRDKRLKAGGLTVFRVKAYDEQGYREFIHRLYKEYKKKKLIFR